MPEFLQKSNSLVFLGNLNPQILTPQFVIDKGIIPKESAPFKDYINNANPFSEFTSTPVIVILKYGYIEIIVQQNRFQVSDYSCTPLSKSPISCVAQKYFEVLEHSPLQVGGYNIVGEIAFTNEKTLEQFEDLFMQDRSKISNKVSAEKVKIDTTIQFSDNDVNCKLQLFRPKDRENVYLLNFNYEFYFKTTMKNFLGYLEKTTNIENKLKTILINFGITI